MKVGGIGAVTDENCIALVMFGLLSSEPRLRFLEASHVRAAYFRAPGRAHRLTVSLDNENYAP